MASFERFNVIYTKKIILSQCGQCTRHLHTCSVGWPNNLQLALWPAYIVSHCRWSLWIICMWSWSLQISGCGYFSNSFFFCKLLQILAPSPPNIMVHGCFLQTKKSDKQSNYINLILSLYWKIRMFAWPINLWPLALEADMTSIDQLLELQRSHVHFNCLERIGNCHSMPCV